MNNAKYDRYGFKTDITLNDYVKSVYLKNTYLNKLSANWKPVTDFIKIEYSESDKITYISVELTNGEIVDAHSWNTNGINEYNACSCISGLLPYLNYILTYTYYTGTKTYTCKKTILHTEFPSFPQN